MQVKKQVILNLFFPCNYRAEKLPCNYRAEKLPCNYRAEKLPCNYRAEKLPCNYRAGTILLYSNIDIFCPRHRHSHTHPSTDIPTHPPTSSPTPTSPYRQEHIHISSDKNRATYQRTQPCIIFQIHYHNHEHSHVSFFKDNLVSTNSHMYHFQN